MNKPRARSESPIFVSRYVSPAPQPCTANSSVLMQLRIQPPPLDHLLPLSSGLTTGLLYFLYFFPSGSCINQPSITISQNDCKSFILCAAKRAALRIDLPCSSQTNRDNEKKGTGRVDTDCPGGPEGRVTVEIIARTSAVLPGDLHRYSSAWLLNCDCPYAITERAGFRL